MNESAATHNKTTNVRIDTDLILNCIYKADSIERSTEMNCEHIDIYRFEDHADLTDEALFYWVP